MIVHVPEYVCAIVNSNLVLDLLCDDLLDLLVGLVNIFVPVVQLKQFLQTLLDLGQHEPEFLVTLVRQNSTEYLHVDVFA